MKRFPLGAAQPMRYAGLDGQIALAHFLTPTGSQIYKPPTPYIESTVHAEIRRGCLLKFRGEPGSITKIRVHHNRVKILPNIDSNKIHPFHAELHPAASFKHAIKDDPDRWSNSVFTNPRFLHFHTCGDDAPGEICWMVLDHTVCIDGQNLWKYGRLKVHHFEETSECLNAWSELITLFDNPSNRIEL